MDMERRHLYRHALLVEDEVPFAEGLALFMQEEASPSWQTTILPTLVQAIQWLQRYCPTVILLDLNLPDSREFQTLDRMWQAAAGVPIVVVTALRGPTIEGQVVARGGLWYLDKYVLSQDPWAFLQSLDAFLLHALV